MTTAHRPTWAPAKGREHQGGARLFGPSAKHSKLDANGFMTMKTRAPSQGGADALLARDLKRELEEKERAAKGGKTGAGRAIGEAGTAAPALALGGDDDEGRFKPRAEDADDDASASGSENDSESDSESDDDDTAALLAELERIKAERAEQTQKKAAAEAAAELEEKRSELAAGNPLLDLGGGGRGGGDFRTKRRWDDDVVFRNQARDEPKVGKRFINDTIRSDFHKRFLNKYIK